jgi:hypothetical protein
MSTQQVVLILGVFVVVAAAAVALILFLNKPEEPEPLADIAPVGGAEVVTAENVEQIGNEVRASVDRGMFMTHFTNVWSFVDGESASYDAVMGNSSSNTYPFWFSVTLRDTGEEVFKSGLIPTGTEIAEIKLSKDLDPGTYNASITVHLMEEDGATPIEGNMGFSVTLVVEG